MKKIFMTVAAIVALTGCSKQEIIDSMNSNAIQFANLNDKFTRSANDANSNYQVYAKWTGGTSAWFINDVVGGIDNEAQNGPYYWPTAGTVDFYSWAPSTVAAATSTYPNLSINYTVPAAANEDFTIASPIENATKATIGVINFQFSHVLSKIMISVDLTNELKDAGYSVSFTGGATLKVGATTATINPMSIPFTWTSLSGGVATYAGNAVTGNAPFIIMPQNAIGCEIQVLNGVSITKGSLPVYNGGLSKYTVVADNIPNDRFSQGNVYAVKLIISELSTNPGGENIFGDKIIFDADVTPWTPITPDPIPQP